MPAEPDRRGAFRVGVNIVPSVRSIEGGRPRGSLHGVLQDLSMDGAQLTLLASEVRRGHRLDVRFELSGDQYHVTAEVRWVRNSRRGNGQYLGVRFETMPGADRRRLYAQISEAQRESRLGGLSMRRV